MIFLILVSRYSRDLKNDLFLARYQPASLRALKTKLEETFPEVASYSALLISTAVIQDPMVQCIHLSLGNRGFFLCYVHFINYFPLRFH